MRLFYNYLSMFANYISILSCLPIDKKPLFCYNDYMDIIYEYRHQNTDALRVFTSGATPRKNSLRIHHHVMIELSLILKGKGVYQVSDAVYTIGAGDVFLFRPNEAHCITDIEEGGMELLNFHIAPSYLYTAFPGALGSNYIKILVTSFDLHSNKIGDVLSPYEMEELRSLLLGSRKECTARRGDFLTVTVNSLCNALIKIARPYADAQGETAKKQQYQNMTSAMAYIDMHFDEPITLDEVASHIGYSRCYFSDVFKRCLGMSVWEYISIKRIEKSLYLIKTTDKNILEIANECGFNNTANFNKTFKKYTHLSPHVFRK